MGMPCLPKISPTVMQSHDARLALRGRIPLEAHNQSLALTADQLDAARAAVLDETLTMLTARGSWPLRQLLLRPTTGILVTAVSITTLLLAVPALGLSPWWTLIALVCATPRVTLSLVLRAARNRATTLVEAASLESAGSDSSLPAMSTPAHQLPHAPERSVRERVTSVLAVSLVLVAASTSAGWSYHRHVDYPRYEVTAPQRFGSDVMLTDAVADRLLKDMLEDNPLPGDRSFHFVYGDKSERAPDTMVLGAVGDLRNLPYDPLQQLRSGFLSGAPEVAKSLWRPDPGRLGGVMECLAVERGGSWSHVVCLWSDEGSVGIVISQVHEGVPSKEAAADTSRRIREAILQPDGDLG